MIPFHQQVLLNALKLFDLLVMLGSFAVAGIVIHYHQFGAVPDGGFLSMRVKVQNFFILLVFLFVWNSIFSLFSLYHSRRLSTRQQDVSDVLRATSLGSLVVWLGTIVFRVEIASPVSLFLSTFWLVSSATAVASRLFLRHVLKRARLHGRNIRHLLIIGANPRTLAFAFNIETHPELGYRILGFVDEPWKGVDELKGIGHSLVCGFEQLPEFLRGHVVDEILVGLPMNSCYQVASRIVAVSEEHGIVIRFLSSLFNPRVSRLSPEHLLEEPILTFRSGAMEGWPAVVKRMLDFTLSLTWLVLLAPLFIAVAALIKLNSPGPVFFAQQRIGLNKRRFPMYKFRTMVSNAEDMLDKIAHLNEVPGPVFKIKNDPRITSFGRFLRKTSIDELPQLFNVLKGDMSLVGPRPLPVRDYQGFDRDWLRRRFSVRPGITCLWQVNGRSSVPFDEWMELDMRYIDEWSLTLDLQILARTIPAVLKGAGAA